MTDARLRAAERLASGGSVEDEARLITRDLSGWAPSGEVRS